VYEEFVTQEIESTFSKAFTKNTAVMQLIKKLLKQEEDYRIFKAELPTASTIDLDKGVEEVNINKTEITATVEKLRAVLAEADIKKGIIHIKGKVEDEHKLILIDNIHQHMPTAQLKAFQTTESQGNLQLECIFFGEFPEDSMDD
jgi:hypothetical protein